MNMTLQERVSDEMRALLARRRLSARQAASALGWNEMYLYRRLKNQSPFDLNDIEALAHLLEVPVGMFFEALEKQPDLPAFTGQHLGGETPGQRSAASNINNASWFDLPSNRCVPPELNRPGQNPACAA